MSHPATLYTFETSCEIVNYMGDRGTFIRQKRLTSELNTFQCLQAPDAKAGAALRGPGQIDSVDLHLEHNTLVIMWPPCQEEWRHEVCCAGSHHIVYWSDAMLVRVTYPAMHVGP